MLALGWATVYDVGPSITHHWLDAVKVARLSTGQAQLMTMPTIGLPQKGSIKPAFMKNKQLLHFGYAKQCNCYFFQIPDDHPKNTIY